MKFTLNWCVFGYPDNSDVIPANQKCAEVCAGPGNSAKKSLTDRLLQTNATLQYLYCNGPNMGDILDECAACLDTVPNAKALGHCEFGLIPDEIGQLTQREFSDAKALGTACAQKPDLGETLKLDFDLFPPAATPISSAPAPGRTQTQTQTQTEIVTLTSALPNSPPSLAAISASAASAVVASSSAAASSKASHDKNVRVGVGVGVGVGGALAILALVCLVLVRRRSAQKKTMSEEEMRARWEMEYQAGLEQKQARDHPRSELGGATGLVEADDGRPNEIPMLENRTAQGSPGTFSSSGGGDTSWSSTLRGSRASRTGLSRLLGTKPAVPAKD